MEARLLEKKATTTIQQAAQTLRSLPVEDQQRSVAEAGHPAPEAAP